MQIMVARCGWACGNLVARKRARECSTWKRGNQARVRVVMSHSRGQVALISKFNLYSLPTEPEDWPPG